MQTNGIREPGQIRPGQRLVIPRYVSTSPKSAPTYAAQPKAGGSVHVVKAGETLMSISRGTGVSVAALAKTNHIDSSKKLSVGDRLTIPQGGHQVAAAHPPAAPKVAEPRTAPAERRSRLRARRLCRPRMSPRKSRGRPRPSSRLRSQAGPCRRSAGPFAAASSPVSAASRTVRRMTVSISPFPKGRPSRRPTTASLLTPATSSRATVISF